MNNKAPLSTTRIDRLLLSNYRCFSRIDVTFDPRLTVIVAPNGGGKTAILDSVAIVWRPFIDAIQSRPGSKGFDRSDVRLKMSAQHTMEPILPTSFDANAFVSGTKIWCARQLDSLERNAKTTGLVGDGDLKVRAQELVAHLQAYADNKRPDAPTLPMVAYYGTGRLFGSYRKKAKVDNPTSRLHGYDDCLTSASRYKHFEDWFERFSREAQQEIIDGRASPHAPREKLRAIQDAVNTMLEPSGWQNLAWSFAQDQIVASHSDLGILPVDHLSDGIRNMIGMVGDIAHRCVRLNPQFGAEAIRMTPGVVLIDEVDMHLHPEWQQTVVPSLLEAFPLIQFIVTTHSPQVLTTVKRENIRMVVQKSGWDWEALPPPQEVKGLQSAVVMNDVMKVNPIPPVTEADWLRDYTAKIEAGTHDDTDGRELFDKLLGLYGPEHPIILDIHRLIRFQAFKLRKNTQSPGK